MRARLGLIILVPVWLTASSFQSARSQVWEKPIAPGLIYREEIQLDPPRMIHSLRVIGQNPVISFLPELAGKTVFEASTNGLGKVSKIVEDTGAIAAINADFFAVNPAQGDPLGLMVRRGTFLSLPNPRRAVFAWGPTNSVFGFARFSGSVTPDGGSPIIIDGFNQECPENKVTFNTPDAGISKSKSPCLTVVLKVDGSRITPSTQVGATVVSASADAANMPLTDGKFTLVAQGSKIEQLAELQPGQRLTIKLSTAGFDWEKIENVVSGGSLLMRDGNIFVDAENQGFGTDFANVRHPRTAVGRTSDGDLLFVTIDGRQKMSVGATLSEAAEIMKDLGCRDALNLDGGGSTTMNILGLSINRPSDKTGERTVANGVAFYGPKLPIIDTKMKFQIVGPLIVDGKAQARVVDGSGKEVPNIEILWSLQGGAWIDQGGQINGLEKGPVTLQAFCRGTLLTAKITIK